MITLPAGFDTALFVQENLPLLIGMITVAGIFLALAIIRKYLNYLKYVA